jgi:hypothetical protein
MATVATLLDGVRYDLRNYADIDFDSPQMIHYLNRAVRTLDYTLQQHNSDWTLTTSDVTLSSGNNSVNVPTATTFNIREVWFDNDRKENLEPMAIYYKREFRESETAEPNFWAHVKDTIIFEVTADQNYTVTVYYDVYTATITAESDSTPYEGRFDDALREAVVLLCESKKYKNPQQADAAYKLVFDAIVFQDVVNRGFIKKNYKLDF